MRVTRAVLPAMRARRAGTVVTLGSVSGRVAVPMVGPYHASKWALEGMIEALRLELIPFGVRVVLIEPGPVPRPSCTTTSGWRPPAAGRTSPYAELLAAYRRQAAKIPRADDLTPLIDVIERAATSGQSAAALAGWADVALRRPAARVRPDRLYELAHAARHFRSARATCP